jgi:adenosine deaminase
MVVALLSIMALPPTILLAQAATPGEQRAVHAFDIAKSDKASALALEAFLARMPKGGDLHMHLSGAVYAETFLKEAAAANLCVNPNSLTLVKNIGLINAGPICAPDEVTAASVLQNQKLYDALVDAFSMRSFVATQGVSGHDQFFATFDRFDAVDNTYAGEWLDEVATRAAAQNEQYLEVMLTPTFAHAAQLGYKIGWPEDSTTSITSATLAGLRDKLLAAGLRDEVAVDSKEFADAKATWMILHCSESFGTLGSDNTPTVNSATTPNDRQSSAPTGCNVKIHWLYQILRGFPPQQVFAQTLLGFEVASADPDVVGINFVMPEDGRVSMQDYHLQMQMLDYLHSVYPKVHISLHAGELAPGLVPPEGLTFHIREAIDVGHAERIGHGVDVMYEKDPRALLKEMADKHVMVEINLTSNDVILGIVPPHHPLPEYRAAHVPVALSTDDEGVSRIDLTHEYVRAAMEYGLGYLDLKAMARTSLEHSFLTGDSLWQKPDDFTRVKAACSGQALGAASPTAKCQALLHSSERAAQQWELEHRFAAFEASLP